MKNETSNRDMSMEKRLKLLFIIDKLGPAGTERQMVEVMRRLQKDTFEVFLCCLSGMKSNIEDFLPPDLNIRVLILEMWSTYSPAAAVALFRLVKFLRTERIDLVQAYHLKAKFIGTLAGKIAGVKTITAVRDLGLGLTAINRIPDNLANLCTDQFLVNSQSIKDYLMTTKKVPDGKIEVITNGVDVGKYRPVDATTKIDCKRKLGIDSKDVVIGVIANLRPVKALDIFIQAAAQIHLSEPRAKFVIVGDGPSRRDLESQASECGLSTQVLFAGSCSDVQFYLQAFDIGVLCSTSEGFSNTMLEYMAAGLPVVATSVGGNREQIRDGWNGFLVPPNDSQSLADSIKKLVHDEMLRATFSEHALENCRRLYSMDHMIQRLEDYFFQVWSASNSHRAVV